MDNNTNRTMSGPANIAGYTGRILRVDLTTGSISHEELEEHSLRKYVGGTTLGIKYIYDEMPPQSDWSSPENRLFLGTGPLGGTAVRGSGTIAAVTKGALTNGIASSQANGYFGAFLRSSGFDAIIIQGAAPEWVYLHIHDGTAEFKDARSLVGKKTMETENALKQELNKSRKQASVISIGPAGDSMVRFACIVADGGHVAAHNGIGAVMGSKKLKAIIVDRGKAVIPLYDKESLAGIAKELLSNSFTDKMNASVHSDGTVGGVAIFTPMGMVPVKNYTTNVLKMEREKLDTYTASSVRTKFNAKRNPCWACSAKHCHTMEITGGKYAGLAFEEPEYEGMAAFSSLVGIDDVTTTMVLNNEVDQLGFDVNETGWVLAWVIECYEKGFLTKKDTDGLDMTWGNGEAIMTMLNRITRRQGFGNILAEGVMRAARHVGGEARDIAVHTMKGTTPRSHDHRMMWQEMFDTCVSNMGTLESHVTAPYRALGLPELYDKFDPEVISTVVARIKGAMIFEDSLVTCRFNTINAIDLLYRAVNVATGWDISLEDAMNVGRRGVNLARAFNLRAGIGAELDAPSPRYGSALPDGLAAGTGIMPYWDKMLKNYYRLMGWDVDTGIPLPETLKALELDFVIPNLYDR